VYIYVNEDVCISVCVSGLELAPCPWPEPLPSFRFVGTTARMHLHGRQGSSTGYGQSCGLLDSPLPPRCPTPFLLIGTPSFCLLRPPNLGLKVWGPSSLASSQVPALLQDVPPVEPLLSTSPSLSLVLPHLGHTAASGAG
jgi:hypothetical protein